MAKLREITGQYAELQKIADSADADDASMVEAIQNSLGDIADSFNEKAEAIVHVVNNMQPDIDAIDKEIKRLSDRKQVIKNQQDSLKDYLRMNMERTGIKKISCPLFTITYVEGRQIVAINNENAIPDEYMVVKTDISPDKLALARALKEGAEVPGASLERSKSSIRIK